MRRKIPPSESSSRLIEKTESRITRVNYASVDNVLQASSASSSGLYDSQQLDLSASPMSSLSSTSGDPRRLIDLYYKYEVSDRCPIEVPLRCQDAKLTHL
jgi:hypothetical protein